MTNNLTRYRAADLPELFDKITRNSIGLNDEYFDRFFNIATPQSNYPPYNLVTINNVESRLEIALAGFKKEDVKVYTEYGKLSVEGSKEKQEDVEYYHQGLAQRSFTRTWTLTDETEVKDVKFEDGLLTIVLKKIVPEHHARKEWF
jgi:molecular chaperone IbpA